MANEVSEKLQKIRDHYYFSHPLFKYLQNKDTSLYLKMKICEKQLEAETGKMPQEQYNRFLNSGIEMILYELLEETKIKKCKRHDLNNHKPRPETCATPAKRHREDYFGNQQEMTGFLRKLLKQSLTILN